MPDTVTSICRYCTAFCPLIVTVENGRAIKVAGDPDAIDYEGYTCPKGRAIAAHTNSPDRLLNSVKRGHDGTFQPIGAGQAVEEIAKRLRAIIDERGPRSVAMYFGNGQMQHPFGVTFALAMFQAIGSPMIFPPSPSISRLKKQPCPCMAIGWREARDLRVRTPG